MEALRTSLLQLCPPQTTRQNKSLFSFFLFMHKDASFEISFLASGASPCYNRMGETMQILGSAVFEVALL